jgi:prophage DNA circulation protein
MTDVYTQRLAQASWRGVVFSVRSEDLPTGGRKTALHDFPNSNERFIEDLGEIPQRFTMTAFVHGLDWLERAQALENALRTAGPGRLVMPTFGAFTVWALPYSKSASQTTVGEIEFSLEFATSRAVAGIIESAPAPEMVFAAGDTARSSIGGAFSKFFKAPLSSIGVTASISDITSAANSAFSSVASIIAADSLGELTSAVRGLLGNAGGLLGDPINLALEFFGIDDDAPGIWQIISEGLDAVESVSALLSFATGFGNNLALIQSDLDSGATVSPVADTPTTPNISLWPATTDDRIERNQARSVLVDSNRMGALVCAYEQAANAEYQTIDQVQTVRTSLEDAYAGMMQVDAQVVSSVPAQKEVRAAMSDLRIRALAVLDQKAQSAWLTSNIVRTGALSAPSLTYLLYAESLTNDLDSRTLQVRQLNQGVSAIAMSGELTVLRGRNA